MHINFSPQNTTFRSLLKKDAKPSQKSPAAKSPLLSAKNLLTAKLSSENTKDIFTPRIIETYMPGTHGTPDIRGRLVKNITLKDSKGKETPGFIIQEIEDENTYYACTKKCALCEMSITRAHPFGTGYIFINSLYGQSNDGQIKGAGTELVKFAIQKSKEAGCDGRLELCMAGSYPFYFKNNFRAGRGYPEHLIMDAALDYTTRKNLWPNDFWKHNFDSINVILDEKGAEALLLGERFFDNSKSETMYSKTLECKSESGKEYLMDSDVDFSDLSGSEPEENACVIQIILKGKENFHKQIAALEMQLLEDKDGKKYLEARNFYTANLGLPLEKTIFEETFKAAETKAKEFGAEYIKTDILNTIKDKK